MPAKLNDFIHDDIPFLWDKTKEAFENLLDLVSEKLGIDQIYILVGAGVLLMCIIIAVSVHKANRRDREYFSNNEQDNPIAEAIATCDYEAIVNGNKNAASYTCTDEEEAYKINEYIKDGKRRENGSSEPEETEIKAENNETANSDSANPVTINMEKIEIVRQDAVRKETSEINYNVSRTGRTFTEEELNELIKD